MKPHEVWLEKARNDLKSSKILMAGNDPVPDTAVFHTQQCAEKSLKAYLAFCNKTIIKTHDIELLIELCGEIDSDFNRLSDNAVNLNPYCSAFRYPDIRFYPDVEDVFEAIKYSEENFNFVLHKIS
jgi:HEPN domain-containing protein